MTDIVYDKINEYSSVKISLASPEEIRSWSYGEVKSRKQLIIERTGQKKMVCSVNVFLDRNAIGSVFAENIKE